MRYSIAIVSLVSALSAACAPSAEPTDPVAAGEAAVITSAIKLPTKLTCQLQYENGSETNILYTRLDSVQSASQLTSTGLSVWGDSSKDEPKTDEIADGWRGDYYGADITDTEYHYNLWTCDTEDRFYTFKTADLLLPADSTATTRKVVGKVNISVRDEGADHDLNCVAHY